MNELEHLLNKIAAFNADAAAIKSAAEGLAAQHTAIIDQAKALGITRPKAAGMLAKIKCEIVVPDTGEASEPVQAAAE